MEQKILIIEDEIQVQENIEQLLQEEGYSTIVSANGKDGIEKVRIDPPDLIICDIMMPGINGYKVKKLLNRDDEAFDIPLIFLTAKTDISDLRKGMDLGADDYIFKPYKSGDLLRTISRKLEKRERLVTKIENSDKTKKFKSDETLFIGIHKKLRAKIKSIIYIEADNQYSIIHLITGKFYYLRKSLTYWEKILPETIFKRIHRSYIINLEYVEKIDKCKNGSLKLTLENIPQEFTVSRRFAGNIKSNIM